MERVECSELCIDSGWERERERGKAKSEREKKMVLDITAGSPKVYLPRCFSFKNHKSIYETLYETIFL